MINKKNKNGFGLIEMVIGVSLASFVFLSLAQVSIISIKHSQNTEKKIQAVNLAKEAMEAVKNIRNEGWDTGVGVLSSGTVYYIVESAGEWSVTDIDPGLIDGIFTREIVFSDVMRDINSNIVASGGSNDTGTKKVTVTVYWDVNNSIELNTYISNILNE